MNKSYIELRNRHDFGETINTYFLFLKSNFKNYTRLYLRYNTISIILLIVSSYLLVTGFMGLASRDFRFGMNDDTNNTIYLFVGGGVLILILFITALVNYSFSSSYMVEYVNNNGLVDSKNIWENIKNNLSTIFLFILLGMGIYIGYLIVSIIFAFIPLIGMIVQYGLSFLLTAFFGLSFMAIFSNNKGLSYALSEGWLFTTSSFGKVILYGLVIGILNLMLTMLIVSIPGFIIAIYVYFSLESNVDLATNVFASVIFTLGFAMFLLAFIYSQALSQVAYSVLYYNIFEEKNNVFLKTKIEEIGVNE